MKSILIFSVLPIPVLATSIIVGSEDCKTPIYSYPPDLEKLEPIVKLIPEEFLHQRVLQARRLQEKARVATEKFTETLPGESQKQRAARMLEQATLIRAAATAEKIESIADARMHYVFYTFKEAGEQIEKENDISAVFWSHGLSRCEPDDELTNKVLAKTIENIRSEMKAFVANENDS